MWKCFNRGVWETIDRSVNVFKSDTSNGTCLISSLAKDVDGFNEDCKRKNNYKKGCLDKEGTSRDTAERNLHCVPHAHKQKLHWALKFRGHNRPSKTRSQDQCQLKPLKGSKGYGVLEEPFIRGGVEKRLTGSPLSNDLAYSCVDRTINGECKGLCSCKGKPSPDLDYICEKNSAEDGRFIYRDDFNKSGYFGKRDSTSLRENVVFVEEQKGSESSSGLDLKGTILSWVNKNASFSDGERVTRGKGISSAENSPQELTRTGSKSNCVLKLPFLCYDLGKFKGLSNISVGWLQNSKSGFKRGDGGKSEGDQNGESEESKEDSWRDCQMHQSFLEAVGWSSAVLFGWFLGQYRFRHIHGELLRDGTSEHKRKCCIMTSLSNFLFAWRGDSALPLKVLPSQRNDCPQEDMKDKHRKVHVEGINSVFDPYDACSPNPLNVGNSEDSGISESPTSKSHFKLLQNEVGFSHDVNNSQKMAIPMPWPETSDERLTYGPITLEEAFKEAGKGLDEAQSQVLLALALQKLDEGCGSTQSDPLPADLFYKSASLGNAVAAFNLGICYEKGVGGVVKNLSQALYWYKQASDKGHAAATYNLAVFHGNGFGGLQPDTKLASQLLLKASSLGLEEASNALKLISSLGVSEECSGDGDCSSLVNQGSFNLSTEESDHLVKSHPLKAPSSIIVKKRQDHRDAYSVDNSVPSYDLITGAFSHFLSGSSLEEMVFDQHPIKSDNACNTSIQLLVQ
ncbi:uncharacterized protein LOC124167980 [Ischnura elegans]|uniref:uncharacterized protein LOC124167980 n=1 Tax=Ischnura elegans TaxID=197161 RepID=UPI001ED880AF|nr:uncharacterized protein LOC124167980 [Ischnura elegans]XP_046402028.1 uncharacterized protein LOC124167980 [Ischnura elegans]